MKQEILTYLNDAQKMEGLYRSDKATFKRSFNELYPELNNPATASFWNERLNFTNQEMVWGSRKEIIFVVLASLVAGLIAKLPAIFNLNEEFFYTRNIGFIIFPLLTGYFSWKNKLATGKIALIGVITLAGLLFINFFPRPNTSDTLTLSCLHLPLLLWSVLGFAFVGGKNNHASERLGFLKYNGDLVVMSALILIAGGIMTGITIGLFSLIGFNDVEFYFRNIGIFGLAAVPFVATYLTQTNPQLVGKVSPVIAKLFSPLVVVMLVIYLIAMAFSGKNPYNDRDFLLLFNALLIGVMALIFFSIAETTQTRKSRVEIGVLLALSIVTIIVNGVALSAILFRISEWGISPNRAAVLGSNVLILIHLLLVTGQLFKVLFKKNEATAVGKIIAAYLPVYTLWAIMVTVVFPILFGFK